MNKKNIKKFIFILSILYIISDAYSGDELDNTVDYHMLCAHNYNHQNRTYIQNDPWNYSRCYDHLHPEDSDKHFYILKISFHFLNDKEKYLDLFKMPENYVLNPKFCYTPNLGPDFSNEISYSRFDFPETYVNSVKHRIISYINMQSPLIFSSLCVSSQYSKAYKFTVAYGDVFSTVDVENAEIIRTTANRWIEEIKTQAREHVKEIGEVIYALFLERGLQAKQISKATLIIESFKEVAPEFREELEKILYDTAHQKRTFDPIAAERLIVYREMADALFNCDDV